MNIYPNLPVGATLAGAAITVLPAHTANMAFHRNAFGLVVRPLSLPESVRAEIVTDDVTGLSVRVVFGWDTNTQSEIISIGMLYGVTVLDPRLATRILG